jgi:fimbrial chaperone protein
MKRLAFLLLILAALPAGRCLAAEAGLEMPMNRIIFRDDTAAATVTVRNSGDAAGRFTAEIVDMKMLESGPIVELEPGDPRPPDSARDWLAATPAETPLKAGQSMEVHIALHKPDRLPDGEYRAHLKVRVVTEAADAPDAETPGLAMRAGYVFIVPVIIRQGKIAPVAARLSQPILSRDANGMPRLSLLLERAGAGTPIGEIRVLWHPPEGKPELIAAAPRIALYPPLARRLVSVPMDEMPAGVDLEKGRLEIRYEAQPEDGGGKIAETALGLPAGGK